MAEDTSTTVTVEGLSLPNGPVTLGTPPYRITVEVSDGATEVPSEYHAVLLRDHAQNVASMGKPDGTAPPAEPTPPAEPAEPPPTKTNTSTGTITGTGTGTADAVKTEKVV